MKTIAIMTGNNQSEYTKSLMHDFDAHAKRMGIRLIFLSGYRLPEEYEGEFSLDDDMEIDKSRFSSIYDYVALSGCDACVICYGPMCAVPGAPSVNEILKLTEDIPRLFLEVKTEDDNAPYIMCESYDSMRGVVDHLVSDHAFKKVVFLAGPKGNYSSEVRMKAYLDVMKEHNIEVTDGMIGYGDYTTRVKPIVEKLLNNNPGLEAICCANDSMARACYSVLRDRGLVVGKDIAVTGFDNSGISTKLIPPLTTVDHDSSIIVDKALRMALDLSEGEETESFTYSPELIRRCSCGCSFDLASDNVNAINYSGIFDYENIDDYNITDQELKSTTVALSKENRQLNNRLWEVSFFVREFVGETVTTDDYFERLFLRLKKIGLSNAYFFVHKTSLIYESEEKSNEKKHMYFAGGFNEEGSTVIPIKEWHHYQISRKKGFSSYLPDYETVGNFHTYVLFAGESQYGVMLSKADISDNEFLLYVSLQISNLLHIYNLKTREEAVVSEMERSIERVKESNQILSFISRYDELTKILNRRGFMEQALATVHRIKGREALIMFGDLDHLKEVNDCFGHGDGDFAITSAAKLITGILPRDGFAARIGGDEFVAFIPVPGDKEADSYIHELKDKLKEAMFLFNLTCNKPYFVEISSGFYSFKCEEDMDLAKIIANSDEVLYEDKQKRRESIKKG